jgi:hypothetical protein
MRRFVLNVNKLVCDIITEDDKRYFDFYCHATFLENQLEFIKYTIADCDSFHKILLNIHPESSYINFKSGYDTLVANITNAENEMEKTFKFIEDNNLIKQYLELFSKIVDGKFQEDGVISIEKLQSCDTLVDNEDSNTLGISSFEFNTDSRAVLALFLKCVADLSQLELAFNIEKFKIMANVSDMTNASDFKISDAITSMSKVSNIEKTRIQNLEKISKKNQDIIFAIHRYILTDASAFCTGDAISEILRDVISSAKTFYPPAIIHLLDNRDSYNDDAVIKFKLHDLTKNGFKNLFIKSLKYINWLTVNEKIPLEQYEYTIEIMTSILENLVTNPSNQKLYPFLFGGCNLLRKFMCNSTNTTLNSQSSDLITTINQLYSQNIHNQTSN